MNNAQALIVIILLLAILVQAVMATNRLTAILRELKEQAASGSDIPTSRSR